MLAHFPHFFALVALFFYVFSHLNLSCIFSTIFNVVESIFEGFAWFWEVWGIDFGRILDFSMIFRVFLKKTI